MEISGYSSLFGTQELEETERVRRRSNSGKSILEGLGTGQDTVSISDEAREKYAEMRAQMQEQEDAQKAEAHKSAFAKPPVNTEEIASANAQGAGQAGAAPATGGGGSGSGDDSAKTQIERLEAKIQTIASSALPDNIKQSTIATYQAQIAELQKQEQAAAQQAS